MKTSTLLLLDAADILLAGSATPLRALPDVAGITLECVDSPVVISTACELTTAQIDQMRACGVSVKTIDYLPATPGQEARRCRGYYGVGSGRYGYGHNSFGHGFPKRVHGSIQHRGYH